MHSNSSEESVPLVRHLFFERIYPLLPVESHWSTYTEVETDQLYISCRSVVMNIAISSDLNAIVTNTLDVIDLIVQDHRIISSRLPPEACHSVLVLLRLLCDVVEYYWDQLESSTTPKNKYYESYKKREVGGDSGPGGSSGADYTDVQNKIFANSAMGYSIVGPGFHETSPTPLRRSIASRLMQVCLRLRYHARSLKIMKNMCTHLFPQLNNTIYQKILPEHQQFLRRNQDHRTFAMVDIALGNLLRYASAANPEQYFEFLERNLKEPLSSNLSTNGDLKYVQNVELIGYVYLNEKTLTRYLDLVAFLNALRKPVFSHLVLYFAASSLLFWIMARPAEYLQVYNNLRTYAQTKQDSAMKTLATQVHNLFEDVYSTFNVSSMLTTSHGGGGLTALPLSRADSSTQLHSQANAHSAYNTSSSSMSSSTSSSSSSISTTLDKKQQHQSHQSQHNRQQRSNSNGGGQSLSSANKRRSSSSQNSMASSAAGNATPLLKSSQSPIISNTPTITALSLLNSPKHSSTDINQYFQSRIPTNSNNSDALSMATSTRPPLNSLPSVNENSRRDISSSMHNTSNPSISSSLNLGGAASESIYSRSTSGTNSASGSSASIMDDMSHIHSLNTIEDMKDITQTDVIHIENILDLYTHFGDNESLPYTSILNFLTTLLMLDTDVFPELNIQSFKCLRDATAAERGEGSYSSTDNEGSVHLERDRNLHMKHFTSGLKRLKSLQLSRKKSMKYVELIVKNITGSSSSTDVALLDSVMCIVSLYSLCASVAKCDPTLPAVVFSTRMTDILGVSLGIGEGWNKSVTVGGALQDILKKDAFSYFQLQVRYISAALQLENKRFMKNLCLEKCLETQNMSAINIYTESFRVFFNLPITEPFKKEVAYKISDFFKMSFRMGSEATLQNIPDLDEDISQITSAILDGTILDENGMRIKHAVLRNGAKYPSNVPSDESLLQAFENAVDIDEGGIEINWSPNSMQRSRSSVMVPTESNSPVSSGAQIISPRARKATFQGLTRSKSPLSMYPSDNYSDTNTVGTSNDPSHTPSISSQLMASTTSTPLQRNTRPLVKHSLSRLRRYSEESNSPSVRLTNSQLQLVDNSSRRVNTTEFLLGKQITINILNTFKRMTSYFILPHDKNPDLSWVAEDFQNIIKPVFVSLLESDEALYTTAQLFMNVLLEYINEYGTNKSATTIKGYLLICTYTSCLLAIQLLNLNLSIHKRAVLMDILVRYLKLRASLIKSSEESGVLDAAIEVEESTFALLHGIVGRAIFISFYSNDPKVQKGIISCNAEYSKLIESYNVHCNPKKKAECTLSLAILKDTAFSTSGATAFQRRIRNAILQLREKPEAIILDCVEKLFRKWYHFTKADKKKTRKQLWEFRNIAGILSAVSGVFLRTEGGNGPSTAIVEDPDSIYVDYNGVVATLRNDFSYFISKQCEWLNNPDLLTRENARDIISLELHPFSLNVLFNHLRNHINQIMNVDLCRPENEMSFVLLEQIIIIIRTILRREDIGDIMLVYSTNIIDVIDRLIVVIKAMPRDAAKYYKSIIHMSKMFKAIQTSEGVLAIKHHYCLKNKWLKLVISWFRTSIQKDFDIENLAKPHREMNLEKRDMDYLYIDTSIESSKAIAYLTEDLPLEIYWTGSTEEIARSKIVFFGKYFNILLKGLKKSMDLQGCPVTVKHKMNLLNENVILALTNISKANTEVSVQFTLPMGYSYNKNIKIAFLKVFTNILSRYPKDNAKVEKERLETIDKLLLYTIAHPDLAIYSARSCPVNDIDQFTAVLVSAFETRNASHIVISELIEDEIQNAVRPSDILRRNSCATRSLALLSKDKGSDYLINTLRSVLQDIMDEDKAVEIEKLDPEDPQLSEKVDLFVKYFSNIIDAIIGSIGHLPKEFFYIAQSIYVEAQKKFPGYGLVAVGSFIFLRLLCPAIVSPETENIIGVPGIHQKRMLLSLAKGIQGLANKSDFLVKWPVLASKTDFFVNCSDKMFAFLTNVCDINRVVTIKIRMDGSAIPFDYSFFHQFIYQDGINIRKVMLADMELTDNIPFLTETLMMMDAALGQLGEPKIEYKNEIPDNIKEISPEYPKLYEFMSRFAFKKYKQIGREITFVRELLTYDGVPILTVAMGQLLANGLELETVVFKMIQLYARIWSSKHYLLFDCTEYQERSFDFSKFVIIMNNIFPDFAPQNCGGVYIINVNEAFMKQWDNIFDQSNIYLGSKVPHHFINTNSDEDLIKYLKVDSQCLDVIEDVRISLHDIMMYDEENNCLSPISMKLGNKFFQVLYETPQKFKLVQLDKIVDVSVNNVYEVADIISIEPSNITGVNGEFMVVLSDGTRLIFCSSKFLEIIKMFEYARSREENDYITDSIMAIPANMQDITKHLDDRNDMIGHLLLVAIVGLFTADDVVKSNAYNLLAAAERAFKLNLGSHLHRTPEVYIPSDATVFLSTMAKSLAYHHPEITFHCWKYLLEGLENNYIPKKFIPQVISFLSYLTDNLYYHVYLKDEEHGQENTSKIIRSLIDLSIREPAFTSTYLNEIWFSLNVDGRLTNLIVTEIINHCLERDSENKDWTSITDLLTGFPTVILATDIVERLMDTLRFSLASRKFDVVNQSWEEFKILIHIATYLFFESTLLVQMFLPEVLFIISVLIDVGPMDLRTLVYELLMNVCNSLVINSILPSEIKQRLDDVTDNFSVSKVKYIAGFSQYKGDILPSFNSGSFATKFNILESFIDNILLLMEGPSVYESYQWKAKYKRYLSQLVFTPNPFLSARATMILGISGKSHISLILLKNLLSRTMMVISDPTISSDNVFMNLSHVFAYSKIVEGLEPDFVVLKRIFWFAMSVMYTDHPSIFGSGLILMASCASRLYEYHFEHGCGNTTLVQELIDARYFAKNELEEQESRFQITWSEDNFVSIIVAFLARALSISAMRAGAIECLISLFKNAYHEYQLFPEATQFKSYMFLLFLSVDADQLAAILRSVNYDDDIVLLNEQCKLPRLIKDWLCSDSSTSNDALYQGAIIFKNKNIDEPTKFRFLVIMKMLLDDQPVCLFRFYGVLNLEMRRLTSAEHNPKWIPVIFEIMGEVVRYSQFHNFAKCNEQSIERIKNSGLEIILHSQVLEKNHDALKQKFVEDLEEVIVSKKTITKLLARIADEI
ncbi:hypothetical protein DAKH74_012540 [Maudiozyma humilis]|uniref:Ras-GAP domain-containing protein n=1 Tax=Maudiozyma humilis TaxID=51915 RepID=A0AAV5RTU1_MAUHU|nr:hypothetical protein DAKH74_012540 [Kazachstania humilis]